MPLRTDHIVYAAPDLDRAVRDISDLLGSRPGPGGAHPGFGTRNHLLSLGADVYLEIVGPDPDQPDPPTPRPFLIDELSEGRIVTWAVRCSNIEDARRRAEERGVHLGPTRAMSRKRPDGTLLSWTLTLPAVLPFAGLLPFLIDWGDTPSPALTAMQGCRLLELSATHPHPEKVRASLDALDVDLVVSAGERPQLVVTVDSPMGIVRL